MITFSKSLSLTALLNAYNNNVVEFSSDNVLNSKKCVINIGGKNIELSPNVNNVFKFDFREVVPVLINLNNFQDLIIPALVASNAPSYIYDDTAETFFSELVTYTITFSDNSTEQTSETYKFLKSVEQLEQNKVGSVIGGNNLYILAPFRKATANTYDLTYFEGYPFDISIFAETVGVLNILNQSNGLSYDFTLTGTISRLFFSDGRTTLTIEDFLPLVEGVNRLKLTRGADVIFINLTKVLSIEGNFVKWLNNYGGWSCWLFNCRHLRGRKTQDLGSVFNDFKNVAETTTPYFELGKNSQDSLTLLADGLDLNAQEVIDGIFDSPRLYYFTGIRLAQVTAVSWLGVRLKSDNNLIKDYNRIIKNYKIELELPPRKTMTL
jgi:hypothetical protein